MVFQMPTNAMQPFLSATSSMESVEIPLALTFALAMLVSLEMGKSAPVR